MIKVHQKINRQYCSNFKTEAEWSAADEDAVHLPRCLPQLLFANMTSVHAAMMSWKGDGQTAALSRPTALHAPLAGQPCTIPR
jgi:hypothetical protein